MESDGIGELPDVLRDWVMNREGRWAVKITAAALPSARVYSGTFGMATWVAREIGEAVVELEQA